ncbi:MAG: hypothetical protein AAB967_04495, partial [Patescibacteria group bacterium]
MKKFLWHIKQNGALPSVIGGVIVIAFLLVALSAPRAEAGFFQDFWDNLSAPFRGGGNTQGTAPAPQGEEKENKNVPLYKPALDYEQAV